jgi:hypothetical protein
MSSPRRLVVPVLAVLVIGLVVLVYMIPQPLRRGTGPHPQVYARLRGLAECARLYSKDFGSMPPPDEMSAAFERAGLASAEFFASPVDAPGQPAFFVVSRLEPGKGALFYANPAFFGGRTTAFTADDGVTLLDTKDFAAFMAEHGAHAQPVR